MAESSASAVSNNVNIQNEDDNASGNYLTGEENTHKGKLIFFVFKLTIIILTIILTAVVCTNFKHSKCVYILKLCCF